MCRFYGMAQKPFFPPGHREAKLADSTVVHGCIAPVVTLESVIRTDSGVFLLEKATNLKEVPLLWRKPVTV